MLDNFDRAQVFLATIGAVLFAIAAVIAVIAAAGIFNTVLLNTRERVRDTATLKH